MLGRKSFMSRSGSMERDDSIVNGVGAVAASPPMEAPA